MTPWALAAGAAALGGAWFSQRYGWWRPTVPYRHPRILMYHMVRDPVPGSRLNGLRVAPAAFEAQLRWLKENGFSGHTVTDLARGWDTLPERTVAITFDDGYADNCENALPLLQRYGFKATLYLVVERFERNWRVYKDPRRTGGELVAEPKLSDAQVARMLESGLVELGSHTLTHLNMATASRDEKLDELRGAKEHLEKQFGVPVVSFAYPFGLLGPDDPALVREAGYENAVTVEPGIDAAPPDPYRLKRVKVSGRENFLAFRIRMRTGRRGLTK